MLRWGLLMMACVLAACSKPEPRSVEYFAVHEDEARAIVADCETDKVRGQECDNARQGVATAKANKALEYKPKG